MLKIKEFKHGARSIETIMKLTTGNGTRLLLPCNLPPREQLGLHVDYDEFMALVHQSAAFKLSAETLAPFIHEFYRELSKKEGWKLEYPEPYDELPSDIMADNIAAACRLPEVLSLVGLVVVRPEQGTSSPPKLVEDIIEANLEMLAKAEHDGWMKIKEKGGWSWAEKRDNKKKKHPALVPYDDLPETDKGKDRNNVRHYPEIVKEAEFLIQIEGTSKEG